jgi:hypothetical protein
LLGLLAAEDVFFRSSVLGLAEADFLFLFPPAKGLVNFLSTKSIRLVFWPMDDVVVPMFGVLLGNSGKPVTLETLSLTKFTKHVFQEQGIHDFRKPGACETSNSRMCEVRGSWFGEEMGSRTCGSLGS